MRWLGTSAGGHGLQLHVAGIGGVERGAGAPPQGAEGAAAGGAGELREGEKLARTRSKKIGHSRFTLRARTKVQQSAPKLPTERQTM